MEAQQGDQITCYLSIGDYSIEKRDLIIIRLTIYYNREEVPSVVISFASSPANT